MVAVAVHCLRKRQNRQPCRCGASGAPPSPIPPMLLASLTRLTHRKVITDHSQKGWHPAFSALGGLPSRAEQQTTHPHAAGTRQHVDTHWTLRESQDGKQRDAGGLDPGFRETQGQNDEPGPSEPDDAGSWIFGGWTCQAHPPPPSPEQAVESGPAPMFPKAAQSKHRPRMSQAARGLLHAHNCPGREVVGRGRMLERDGWL